MVTLSGGQQVKRGTAIHLDYEAITRTWLEVIFFLDIEDGKMLKEIPFDSEWNPLPCCWRSHVVNKVLTPLSAVFFLHYNMLHNQGYDIHLV